MEQSDESDDKHLEFILNQQSMLNEGFMNVSTSKRNRKSQRKMNESSAVFEMYSEGNLNEAEEDNYLENLKNMLWMDG